MKIKDGVIMAGLQLPMRIVLKRADVLYKKYGQELTVTAALDGTHSAGSLHYYGYAVDLRTRYFPTAEAKEIAVILQNELGTGYTVLFEGNHIHVQYNVHRLDV